MLKQGSFSKHGFVCGMTTVAPEKENSGTTFINVSRQPFHSASGSGVMLPQRISYAVAAQITPLMVTLLAPDGYNGADT